MPLILSWNLGSTFICHSPLGYQLYSCILLGYFELLCIYNSQIFLVYLDVFSVLDLLTHLHKHNSRVNYIKLTLHISRTIAVKNFIIILIGVFFGWMLTPFFTLSHTPTIGPTVFTYSLHSIQTHLSFPGHDKYPRVRDSKSRTLEIVQHIRGQPLVV